MKIGTVRMPSEWQEHVSAMRNFIDNYAHHAGQPFKVNMVGAGQKHWIETTNYGTLTEIEKAALDNAVSILNDRITNLRQDPSTAAIEANRELEERSKEIDNASFRQSLINRILS